MYTIRDIAKQFTPTYYQPFIISKDISSFGQEDFEFEALHLHLELKSSGHLFLGIIESRDVTQISFLQNFPNFILGWS